MKDSSKFYPWDAGRAKIDKEVLLRVESIRFESHGESSLGCGLEKSNGTEFKSSKRLNDGFFDTKGIVEVVLLVLVSFKWSKWKE